MVVSMFALLLAQTAPVAAEDSYGLEATAQAAKLVRGDSPATIAGNIIGAALSLVGVLFFILMVYAGITWMLARGNEDQTKQALRTIIAAVIGMVITLASYAITSFVFDAINQVPDAGSGVPTEVDGGVDGGETSE